MGAIAGGGKAEARRGRSPGESIVMAETEIDQETETGKYLVFCEVYIALNLTIHNRFDNRSPALSSLSSSKLHQKSTDGCVQINNGCPIFPFGQCGQFKMIEIDRVTQSKSIVLVGDFPSKPVRDIEIRQIGLFKRSTVRNCFKNRREPRCWWDQNARNSPEEALHAMAPGE
jgi:hypothetical protein